MARIRTLKPEILEDEKTSALSDAAFRLFVSMIVLADDHGNVRADVRWLAGQIWWQHEPKPNVLLALVELSNARLISVYGVRGGTYATLPGWTRHQRIDNAGKGRVPSPDDSDSQLVKVDEHGLEVVPGHRPVNGDRCATGNQGHPGSGTEGSARIGNPAEIRGENTQTWGRSASNERSRGDPGSVDPRGEIRLDLDLDRDQEEEREGEPAAKPPRHSPKLSGSLPAGWCPGDLDRARAEARGLDPARELEKFRNYHKSKGSRRADWDAAWRSWIDKAQEFAPQQREQAREIGDL